VKTDGYRFVLKTAQLAIVISALNLNCALSLRYLHRITVLWAIMKSDGRYGHYSIATTGGIVPGRNDPENLSVRNIHVLSTPAIKQAQKG
jgi:hypothetical protein